MAIVYYDAGASGADDGSSPTDAWEDLQDAFTNMSAGDHLYLKKHSSRVGDNGSTQITFNKAATSGAPSRIEGYGSTPGDGVHFETSYDLRFEGEHVVVAYIDSLVTTNSSNSWRFNGDNQLCYRCKVEGHYAFGLASFIDAHAVECSFRGLIGAANDGVVAMQRSHLINCYVESMSTGSGTNGGACLRISTSYRSSVVCDCLIVEKRSNPGDSIGIALIGGTQASNQHIANNTIHKFGRSGIRIDDGIPNTTTLGTTMIGNLFYDLVYGIEHLQGTNTTSFGYTAMNNAYGAVSSGQTTGMTENFDPVALTGDPFVDHTDYELNTTSGAGALVRGLRGLPDIKDPTSSTRESFPSFGAIQPELGGSGGGGGTVGFAI